jgi:hypothetical protein
MSHRRILLSLDESTPVGRTASRAGTQARARGTSVVTTPFEVHHG